VVVIRPAGAGLVGGLREVWEYRELLGLLVMRDIRVRYKQTVLGCAWAIIQPVMTMAVFSVVFGRLAGIPSDGAPYPVFAYAALLPWQLFAQALGQCTASLVGSYHLISKVYFPRLIVPLAGVLSGLVDFAVAFGVLVLLLAYYRLAPGPAVLALPLLLLLAVVTALAVGLWLAVLNVQYRDVRYLVPFVTQFWLFATPVAYPSSLVPEAWRPLFGLNPMAGVVEGFRWALLGSGQAPGPLLAVSVGVVLALLAGGYAYFRRAERTFADVV
jgi:lipopolysaccharide transport system permease protein